MDVTFSGGTGTYTCSLDGGAPAACVSPATFSSLSAGEHTVVVTDGNGCAADGTSKTIVIPTAVALVITKTDVSCNGAADGTIPVSVSGGTPGYTCKLDGGSFGACPLAYVPVGPGLHTVIAKDANGCTDTKQVTITQPDALTVALGDVSCGNGSTITATPAGGTGPYSYAWQIIGGSFNPIPTSTDATVTYNTSGGSVSVKVTVTDANNCTANVTSAGDCSAPSLFCTLTQGAYGNKKGQTYLGDTKVNRFDLLWNLLNSDLTLGVPGERSLTFEGGGGAFGDAGKSAQCIINRLPAGTSAKVLFFGTALPNPLNESLNASCDTTPDPGLLTLNKQGRWQNILLGQTLTLALNVRFDAYHEAGLGDLSLCKYMTSLKANVVVDSGGNVTEEPADLCKANLTSRVIPEAVLAELDANGGRTVNDLLALANRALAGEATDSTLDEINQAISAVNELFDECRYLIYCSADAPYDTTSVPDCSLAINAPVNGATRTAGDFQAAALNPFSTNDDLRLLVMQQALIANRTRRDGYAHGNS
jgi:hypothetical protein